MKATPYCIEKCSNFLLKLIAETEARCENSIASIRKIEFLKPSYVANPKLKTSFADFPENFLKTDVAEEEYRRMATIDWYKEIKADSDKLNPIDFWSHVASNPAFSNVGKYAMSLLTIPFFNAVVERIFSIAGSVKTKPRNRLSLSSLEAVVIVREFVNFMGNAVYLSSFTKKAEKAEFEFFLADLGWQPWSSSSDCEDMDLQYDFEAPGQVELHHLGQISSIYNNLALIYSQVGLNEVLTIDKDIYDANGNVIGRIVKILDEETNRMYLMQFDEVFDDLATVIKQPVYFLANNDESCPKNKNVQHQEILE
ncbi:MAG: hypothetical protein MHMPM18_000608 [Marteilia pararefringens]